MGRGWCLDDVKESSGISEGAMCEFFHQFCERFVQEYYHDFVKRPEGDDLQSVMEIYEKLGFPGCVGSIDCTHIRWDRCPVSLANLCKGKGQHPTLVFEATVHHNRRVLGMTRSFYGTINDKTIVKSDSYVQDVKDGAVYGDVKYKITMADGRVVEKTGVYFLCDGGYHRWTCLMSPVPPCGDVDVHRWSEWLESVRKDVECFFGILKGRFRWLKMPILLQKQKHIDNAVFLCCILHNMLLDFDGEDDLETEEWAANGDWDLFHPQQRADDDNFDETGIPLHEANFHDQTRVRRNNVDDYDYQTGQVIEREVEESFMSRQGSLIAHFPTMFNVKIYNGLSEGVVRVR